MVNWASCSPRQWEDCRPLLMRTERWTPQLEVYYESLLILSCTLLQSHTQTHTHTHHTHITYTHCTTCSAHTHTHTLHTHMHTSSILLPSLVQVLLDSLSWMFPMAAQPCLLGPPHPRLVPPLLRVSPPYTTGLYHHLLWPHSQAGMGPENEATITLHQYT